MSREINIAVKNKIAFQTDDTVYVCGNSDFAVVFDFDDDWADLAEKTARFYYNGIHQDVVFVGSICPVPIISNAHNIKVGVFAGNLRTTTPAMVSAKKSILCLGGSPAAPADNVYHQIMGVLSALTLKVDELSGKMTGLTASVEDLEARVKALEENTPSEPDETVKLSAPVIWLEQTLPKLAAPVIRLEAVEDSGETDDAEYTPAILGMAVLGKTILGKTDGTVAARLAAPVIRLETVTDEEPPETPKLTAPVIELLEEAPKLDAPEIRLETIIMTLAAPVIELVEG